MDDNETEGGVRGEQESQEESEMTELQTLQDNSGITETHNDIGR